VLYISALRELYTRMTGQLLEQAGYRRRALLVGSGEHIEAVAHAIKGRSRTNVDLVGYISLTPRPDNGLRSLGQLDQLSNILASLGLVVLAPVFLTIAIAIKLSSRGPAIYRSIRPGMAGKPFHCFKFRTMREHADQIQTDLESLNELSGALFKIRKDPRLTNV